MQRWQHDNFNVLSGQLLHSNTRTVQYGIGCLYVAVFKVGRLVANHLNSFNLYALYHILSRDQVREELTLPEFQLKVIGNHSISILLLWQPLCSSGKRLLNSWCGLAPLTVFYHHLQHSSTACGDGSRKAGFEGFNQFPEFCPSTVSSFPATL